MILPENRTLAFSTLLFWGPILGTDWGSAEFYFGIRRVRFWQLQSPMLAFAAFHSGGQTRRITKWLFSNSNALSKISFALLEAFKIRMLFRKSCLRFWEPRPSEQGGL
jgi:hypothetical protein